MRDWLFTIGVGIVLTVLILLSVGAAYFYLQPDQPRRPVLARITRVGADETRWRRYFEVDYVTVDGERGTTLIARDALSCRAGDLVKALKQGASVLLEPGQCARGAR